MESMESNEYKAFFEESCDLLCVLESRNLTFQHLNRKAWESTFKWPYRTLIGKSIVEFLNPSDDIGNNYAQKKGNQELPDSRLHSADQHNGECDFRDSAINTKISVLRSRFEQLVNAPCIENSLQIRFRTQDGVYRWLSLRVTTSCNTPRNDRFFVSGRDVTLQHEREIALVDSERRIRESQEISLMGQWDYEFKTKNLRWSPMIYKIFGIDPENTEASYEAFLNTTHPDDRVQVNAAWESHLKTRLPYEIDHRVLLEDGTLKWVKERCRSEFSEDNSPICSMGTVQDISDLRLAKDRAEESDRLKSAFLANMSHEIRTPMNAVIGFTDLMLMESNHVIKEHRDYLEIIQNSGRLLLTLINDILDLSKIEAGQLQIQRNAFSLMEVLRSAENNAQGLLARKQKSLARVKFKSLLQSQGDDEENPKGAEEMLSSIAPRIMGDPIRLQQVLNNLLSNAIKFTENGTVEYSVRTVTRTNGHSWKPKMLEFRVVDTGAGIPLSKQSEIFKPFRQAHRDDAFSADSADAFGGSGLGLCIALKLVQSMGGEMSFTSSTNPVDHGSTFRFTIPYFEAKISPAKTPVGSETDSATGEPNKAPVLDVLAGSVLLVDDNKVNLKLCERFVTKMGCRPTTANNGAEALAVFQNQRADDPFDVVLMDKEMPVMCGLESVKRIRAFEMLTKRRRIPIAAVTASAMPSDRDACLAAGFDDYLAKPLTRVALHQLLSQYLPKRSETRVRKKARIDRT